MRSLPILLSSCALAACAAVPAPPREELKLAITVDDLPVHGGPTPGESHASIADSMARALVAGGATDAHGFVNGVWVERDPATLEILKVWRRAGLPLANHGWAHRHLNEMSLAEFEREVGRNEPLLTQLQPGEQWRWFRYPFLGEGDTPEKRIAARKLLAGRGYRIAAVTMDFSDWQWSEPYARCKSKDDRAALARLEQSYLGAARENIRFYRNLSSTVHSRDIPYVLLLHASALTARLMPRLLKIYRAEGFRFVSLQEAQRDPAYADQMDPAQPPLPQGLEGKARSRSLQLPPRTDYAPMLETLCR